PPQTVMQALDATAEQFGARPALRFKTVSQGHRSPADAGPSRDAGSGTWQTRSWAEYRADVWRAAKGLIALGLEPGKAVTLIGFNCPQWLVGNLAAIYAGGIPVGIYTTSSAEQCQYIAEHADANVAIVDNREQLAKFLEI